MKLKPKVTGKTYFIKRDFSFNGKNVIYLITCDKCNDEYVGSVVVFKSCFRVYKSEIKIKKGRCGISEPFNEECLCFTSLFEYIKVEII